MNTLFNILFSFFCSFNILTGMQQPSRPVTTQEHTPILAKYESGLPKISKTKASQSPAQRIVEFLCHFSCGDMYRETGQETLVTKVEASMSQGEPVKLLIVSFAVKSCNEETKVFKAGTLDFAEYVGLFTLNYMCTQIQEIYPPGAQVTIYTREAQTDYANIISRRNLGCELFPEAERQEYQRSLATIVSTCFPCLSIGNSNGTDDCFTEHHHRFTESGYTLTAQDKQSLEAYTFFWTNELDCSRFREATFNHLGFKTTQKKQEANKQKNAVNAALKKTAQEVAQCLLMGGKVMRTVLETIVPDYQSCIRLSVRAPENGDISSKLGIALVYGSQGTPWHSIAVTEYPGMAIRLMSQKDMDKQRERDSIFEQKQFNVNGIPLVYYTYAGRECSGGGLYS